MRHTLHLSFRLLLLAALFIPLSISTATTPDHSNSHNMQDGSAPVVNIGDIQGSVLEDEAEPETFRTNYVGQVVRVSGVVTNPIKINASGRIVNGFFLQEPTDESDGDPSSSDGIQVLIGGRTDFDDYTPLIGDRITIEAEVEEYYNLTRLRLPTLISVDGHVTDLDALIPYQEINPRGTLLENSREYERLEGMRVTVPIDSIVVAPTHIFTSTNDTEIYVVRGDHPVAERDNPFARRVFRDPHPLDDGLTGENPYRISVEANILKALENDYDYNLPAFTTYDRLTPLTGNLVYAYGRYTLQIDQLPEIEQTVLPFENDTLIPPERGSQYSVAIFNVQNLYDYYNDPFDGDDNPADTRLNYTPRSLEEYQTHVSKVALTIVESLASPDIVAFQELEDQDVCVDGGQLFGTCSDEIDNANGQPDVLEDVAAEISRLTNGEIIYAATLDRDGADYRGIIQAYLYRTDRVELVEPNADHPLLGARPDDPAADKDPQNQEVSNPKALNRRFGVVDPLFARAPVVALFRIHREAVGSEDYVEVYLSNNHFKSNPTGFIELRKLQAEYNLQLVRDVQQQNPDAYFMVLGDLNSFAESEEMAVLEAELDNLWDDVPAASRYSYIFAGQTQTLDYIFVTASLKNTLSDVHYAHYNADFSYEYEANPTVPYRAGDHDPMIAIFDFPQ
jgi:hypothetical protein